MISSSASSFFKQPTKVSIVAVNLSYWWDASEYSTITASSQTENATVTQWKSKKTATKYVTTSNLDFKLQRSLTNLWSIRGNGIPAGSRAFSTVMNATEFPTGTQSFTCFAVFTVYGVDTVNHRPATILTFGSSNYTIKLKYVPAEWETTLQVAVGDDIEYTTSNAIRNVITTTSVSYNVPILISFQATLKGLVHSMYFNGEFQGSSTANSNNNSASTDSSFMRTTNGSYPFNGLYHEFLMVKSLLSTSTHQSIEGQLAAKWGVILDQNHPYKNSTDYVHTLQ